VQQKVVGEPFYVAPLVEPHIPNLPASKITTGVIPVARGGTGVAMIPAFSVHKNGVQQTGITSATMVKATWSTEAVDNNNNFASNKFTPTIAGTYMFSAALRINGAATLGEYLTVIYKNGSEIIRAALATATGQACPFATGFANANGTTDFFEVFAYQGTGSTGSIDGFSSMSFFSGIWVGP
jgi:hypothetical protein